MSLLFRILKTLFNIPRLRMYLKIETYHHLHFLKYEVRWFGEYGQYRKIIQFRKFQEKGELDLSNWRRSLGNVSRHRHLMWTEVRISQNNINKGSTATIQEMLLTAHKRVGCGMCIMGKETITISQASVGPKSERSLILGKGFVPINKTRH